MNCAVDWNRFVDLKLAYYTTCLLYYFQFFVSFNIELVNVLFVQRGMLFIIDHFCLINNTIALLCDFRAVMCLEMHE